MAKAKNNAQSKPQEYELYKLWKSLSPLLRLRTAENLEDIGIEDPDTLSLLNIPHQKAFAKKFKVAEATLVEWNKKLEADKDFQENRFNWMKKLTGNVLAALYEQALKEGDAPRTKLWMQIIEGWQEKSQVTDPEGTKTLKELTTSLQDIIKRR
jgi:hypothetical protein